MEHCSVHVSMFKVLKSSAEKHIVTCTVKLPFSFVLICFSIIPLDLLLKQVLESAISDIVSTLPYASLSSFCSSAEVT